MSALLTTKSYARSETGRAILEAAQFAHVPEADVWSFLDDPENYWMGQVRLYNEVGWDVIDVRRYHADWIASKIQAQHGSLCPVCLCPILGKEPRAGVDRRLLPNWLHYQGDDQFLEDGTHPWWGEPNCKGTNHLTCEEVMDVIDDLEEMDRPIERRLEHEERWDYAFGLSALRFFKKRRWQSYLEALRRREAPPLRFNPRTAPRGSVIIDDRFKVDELEALGIDYH